MVSVAAATFAGTLSICAVYLIVMTRATALPPEMLPGPVKSPRYQPCTSGCSTLLLKTDPLNSLHGPAACTQVALTGVTLVSPAGSVSNRVAFGTLTDGGIVVVSVYVTTSPMVAEVGVTDLVSVGDSTVTMSEAVGL